MKKSKFSDEQIIQVLKEVEAGAKVAETIFHNGTILTMVDATPRVAAVAVAGEDGRVRIIDPKNGRIVTEFVPAPVTTTAHASTNWRTAVRRSRSLPTGRRAAPSG